MSVENKEVPQLSMLEQLKQQHAGFIAQRDLAQTNLNQLVGAIFACDIMIKKFEEEEAKNNMAVMDNSIVDSKEQEDGREMDSKGNQ